MQPKYKGLKGTPQVLHRNTEGRVLTVPQVLPVPGKCPREVQRDTC
jgi:hypothetical protein